MEVDVGTVANAIVAVAYLAVSLSVTGSVLRHERRWRDNPLAVATAAIFFTCGIGHGMHGVPGLPNASGWMLAFWDAGTALIAVYYWSLRASFPALRTEGALFSLAPDRVSVTTAATLDALPQQVHALAVRRDSAGTPVGLTVSYCNAAALALSGRGRGETLGQPAEEVMLDGGGPALLARYLQVAVSRQAMHETMAEPGPHAGRAFDIDAVPYLDGVLVSVQECTDRVRAEIRLRRSQRLLAQAQRLAAIGSWEYDLMGGVFSASDELGAILGTEPHGFPDLYECADPADRARVARLVSDSLRRVGRFRWEYAIRRPDGSVRHLSCWGEVEGDLHGRPMHAWGTAQDITAVKHRELSLLSDAMTDHLTGVTNRRGWDDAVAAAVRDATERGEDVCVAILDLDFFKAYNDRFGHPAGDALLRACATAWSSRLRRGDLFARLGGEEFGVLLRGCDLSLAQILVANLRAATPDGVTVSVGLGQVMPQETAVEVLGRVDTALYAAKNAGRDVVQLAGPPSAAAHAIPRQGAGDGILTPGS